MTSWFQSAGFIACCAAFAVLLAAPPSAAQEAPGQAQPPPAALPPDSLTTAVTRQANLEGRVLWIDGTANLQRLSTRDAVSDVLEKCRKANINTVVVDVKPLSGEVLYDSKIAPRLREWKGFQYPQDFDLLSTVLFESRRRGIRVYASINVFSEGHKLAMAGPLYGERRSWQATVYEAARTVTAADGASTALSLAENQGPADGQIAAYTRGFRETKRLGAQDAAILIQNDAVTALIDGSLVEGGPLEIPENGYLLIGRGAGARWLMEHVRPGQPLNYAVKEALLPILDAPSEAVGGFVNPADPVARAYEKSIVEEIADRYGVDGIVFDRMRYSGLRTDFSPLSRELFEKWLGKKVDRFPQDIYSYSPAPGQPVVPGPYYKEWLEWRAVTIRDWLQEARTAALSKRPGLQFGVYVGSWYPSYFGVGVNWGADDYAAGYEWMTLGYPRTGYAGKLDWLTTGCYYGVATREDARQLGRSEEATVQAAAETSVRAVNDAAFVYAGVQVLDYQGRPEEFRRAVQAAVQSSQGVMLFDLVYIEEYNWWNILSDLFSVPRRAPHDVPGLRTAIRGAKKALANVPAPPAAGGQ